MNINIPFERAAGLLLLLLVVLVPVSTAISGYDTARDGWEGELTRLGELSDIAVTMNIVFQALAGIGLIAAGVLFYLTLASRSRNLAAIAGAFMFAAGLTTIAASAMYSVVAELADAYVEGAGGDGVLTTSRAFANAMDALVMFSGLTLSLSVYVLAAVAHRERLVPRWTTGIAIVSAALLLGAVGNGIVSKDDNAEWLLVTSGLLLMGAWLVIAGLTLLLGSRAQPGIAAAPTLSGT